MRVRLDSGPFLPFPSSMLEAYPNGPARRSEAFFCHFWIRFDDSDADEPEDHEQACSFWITFDLCRRAPLPAFQLCCASRSAGAAQTRAPSFTECHNTSRNNFDDTKREHRSRRRSFLFNMFFVGSSQFCLHFAVAVRRCLLLLGAGSSAEVLGYPTAATLVTTLPLNSSA